MEVKTFEDTDFKTSTGLFGIARATERLVIMTIEDQETGSLLSFENFNDEQRHQTGFCSYDKFSTLRSSSPVSKKSSIA
ncbi:unnamed protein product [Nesidiocoris tenuis]|uniref:Uncharacterized protein n=1 Tax=Nesidiocoris tenuis TaxID=355587 RepID=A0A6H5FZW2_9HEMI|nr:unnamed protein product [Nesidiocoris tenuis]